MTMLIVHTTSPFRRPREYRPRPQTEAVRAERMEYDFQVEKPGADEQTVTIAASGNAGQWLVQGKDGFEVLSDQDFHKRYQRVVQRTAKPKVAEAKYKDAAAEA
jgi:HSP20 family molecular chaperone IbpA